MQIYVDNKLAALKKGTSFEYVSENRLFSGSDGYTLTITFPLRGCPENIAIFGHINRADVAAQKVIFDCEIRDKGFYKFGSITITEISETEVKTQFLEGRSEQNFDKTFDKVYINELTLGSPKVTNPALLKPWQAWSPNVQGYEAVALPWWNDSDSGLAHNFAEYADGKYSWASTTHDLTWQPYLLFITKKICEAVGYSYDFSKWEETEEYKYLLICNTLPGAWDVDDYARALPHWNIDEYFEKLELFLGGEFTIDHRAKRISFAFTRQVLNATASVRIDRLVEDHSVEVTVEDEKCEYQEAKNLVYKSADNVMWNYYSCDWFIKAMKGNIVKYKSLSELLSDNKWLSTWNGSSMRGSNLNKVLYAEDIDTYFIIRTVSRTDNGKDVFGHPRYIYKCMPQPINIFGGRIVDDSEDADEIEIEFVPARIDDTEEKYGRCLFLSFSGFAESSSSGGFRSDYDYTAFQLTGPQSMLRAGEKEKKAEYYDRIFVGWWDGATSSDGKLPHPYVEDVEIADDWSNYRFVHFSLRLNNKYSSRRKVIHRIDPRKKATFKFLSDTIPNPRAVFFIKGKKYLCEKITATFSENGMSQLLKGVFYPIED